MKELKNRLHEEMSELNQLIQQSEGKHRNKNIGMGQSVTELKRRMEKYRSFVLPGEACPPDLITRHVDDQELKDLFGQLGTKTVNPPLPQRRKMRSGRLVMDAKIVSRFTSDQTSVVTTGNDQAWIWNFNDRHMSLVTSDGEVIQCINTEFDVCDAAVSTYGDLLVTVCNGNKVKMLTKHKTFTDVYTAADDCLTGGITTSDTGNVLVTLNKVKDSKVVEISTSGKLVRTIQYDTADNKSLFDRPWFICSNINGDIIVSDDRNKVVAVSESGTKRFIYDGKERKLQNSFNPRYVVTDKYGNILIADYYNSAVHVLDQDGKFIKYLITGEHGCDKPFGMDINSSDRLWLYNNGPSEVFVTKLSYNRM
ncbi:hypothetical protein KUTeg_003997 [Tegillarca granosa]|uniref:Tripartite motif-containing protein 2 n=1 Tax=Tegillarca granosa TaxID=220873 RepID=A0ABQ9FNP2_TEGGR|nr:hypothetical protein KUTeg_003997 [Tegillarca granosa]